MNIYTQRRHHRTLRRVAWRVLWAAVVLAGLSYGAIWLWNTAYARGVEDAFTYIVSRMAQVPRQQPQHAPRWQP